MLSFPAEVMKRKWCDLRLEMKACEDGYRLGLSGPGGAEGRGSGRRAATRVLPLLRAAERRPLRDGRGADGIVRGARRSQIDS